jgi:hypothetical protein
MLRLTLIAFLLLAAPAQAALGPVPAATARVVVVR